MIPKCMAEVSLVTHCSPVAPSAVSSALPSHVTVPGLTVAAPW